LVKTSNFFNIESACVPLYKILGLKRMLRHQLLVTTAEVPLTCRRKGVPKPKVRRLNRIW